MAKDRLHSCLLGLSRLHIAKEQVLEASQDLECVDLVELADQIDSVLGSFQKQLQEKELPSTR